MVSVGFSIVVDVLLSCRLRLIVDDAFIKIKCEIKSNRHPKNMETTRMCAAA